MAQPNCLSHDICGLGTICNAVSGMCTPAPQQSADTEAPALDSGMPSTVESDSHSPDGALTDLEPTPTEATDVRVDEADVMPSDAMDSALLDPVADDATPVVLLPTDAMISAPQRLDATVADMASVDSAAPEETVSSDMGIDTMMPDMTPRDSMPPDGTVSDVQLADATLTHTMQTDSAPTDMLVFDAEILDASSSVRCDDEVLNGDETGVDCGGDCSPCADGNHCWQGLDCLSGVCTNNVCRTASCRDEVLNADESDVDCGGSCEPCPTAHRCRSDGDCASQVCISNSCAEPSCFDGVRNGEESDLDCGQNCPPCRVGLRCDVPSDCGEGVCAENRCLAARCGDRTLNGDEVCDDGNEDAGDACTTECLPAQCGDGFVYRLQEACDDQGESATCDVDCTIPVCGDGLLNRLSGERCDDGAESAFCNEDCTLATCGDGYINTSAGEACDGGERCDANCLIIPIPRVSIESPKPGAYEGGAVAGSFRVHLSEPVSTVTNIPFSLAGTAHEGTDFTLWHNGAPLISPLVVPPNTVSVDIDIRPVVTSEMERTEWVSLGLQASPDIELEPSARRARVWLYEFGRSVGSVFYVSPDGSDDAVGSEAEPFATFGHALQVMQAGDTLYVFDGEYTNPGYDDERGPLGTENINNPVLATVGFSGDASRWTTIAAYPDGNDVRPVLRFDGAGGLLVDQNASHIVIDGLEIYGPNKSIHYNWAHEHRWSKEPFYMGRGIFSWGPVHHIVVRNCHIHHTPNSGIRFNGADYILVENNVVSNTTWWSSSAESGIVIATAKHVDELDIVKILYSGNIVYNNWNLMEFCSGPLGPVGGHEGSTEDVYGNCDAYTGGIIDGQGLYVTRNRQTYLHGRMRFENNIAFNNGFGGVVYHKTDRGELVNNLVFMNGAYPGLSNYTGMTLNSANDVFISNNIIWARDGDDYALKNNGGASAVVATHNYVVGISQFGSAEDNAFVNFEDAPNLGDIFTQAANLADIVPDPHVRVGSNSAAEIDDWIQSLNLDFYPNRSASELIDQGAADKAPSSDARQRIRPQQGAVDIGPYEVLP